jgi:parallel beta-helix repeat protein
VRERLLTGLSVSLLTVGVLAVAGPAQAAPSSTVVTCGQTVTASTRLANNLVNCPGDGLVIGADHVTLDLAGHSIRGVNAPGSEGIADDGHGRVTVKNGTIANFFLNGIGLRGAPGSAVKNMTIHTIGAGGAEPDTSAGVLVKDSPNSSVVGSSVTNNVSAFQSDGVDVLSSAGAVVSGNQLTRNAWNGMVVLFSAHTRVLDNTFNGNQNQGIEVNFGSGHALLARNRAADNVSNGLVVGAISGARIEDNTVTHNGDSGLFMFDLLNSRISRNSAHGNGGAGIDLEGGQNGSTGNRITGNNTSGNDSVGLVVAEGANKNVVAENVSNANQGSPGTGGGIIVFAGMGNTVRGNVANRNLDVGIGIFEGDPGDATGNVVTHNVANANHAHGIDAVAGTVDRGSNIAHHNTPPPDCLGVVCK